MSYRVVAVNDAAGHVVEQDLLRRAASVHRELRPHLMKDYVAQMERIFAGGARMVIAIDAERNVVGVAVYRQHENTFDGVHCYVDDLVTAETERSKGVGEALLNWIEVQARESGCSRLKLDSGTQRGRAHQFYFREGMQIASFHFFKDLD